MREQIEAAGHQSVPEDAQPDVFVLNSCTVTAESDRKTRQLVRRFRHRYPQAVIVLTGCMPQAFPKDAAALDAADVVLGNATNARLLPAVEEYLRTGRRVVEITPHKTGERFSTPPVARFSGRTRAFLKIEDGCNRFCSYCIIPMARGRVRSKPVDEIREEVARLAAAGHREVVLVGINLSAYGGDVGVTLADAVDAAAQPEGIARVRLGSLEPDQFTDALLARLGAQEKFCPQFHLSLQSGCDETLRRMNRHYDAAFYADLAARIRAAFPDAALTTDVMVGFAGETEDEFGQSLDFMRRIGFARAHVFAYSRRAGTAAYDMPNQLTAAVKEERSRRMIACADSCRDQFLRAQLGRTFPVLFETCSGGFLSGYTPNYTHVRVHSEDETLCGEIRPVRLIEVDGDVCRGELTADSVK